MIEMSAKCGHHVDYSITSSARATSEDSTQLQRTHGIGFALSNDGIAMKVLGNAPQTWI